VREWSAEVVVDESLARRLLSQFPDLAVDSLELIAEGWDNAVWLVDGTWAFRFPRRSIAIPGVEREIAVLPRLAPLLPLPIPVPTFVGRPAHGYPWAFFGAPFLPGREVADADLSDDARNRVARPLGTFLRTLHAADAEAFTAELPADPMGRGDMAERVPRTRERLDEVQSSGLWEAPRSVQTLLAEAERLPRCCDLRRTRWVKGSDPRRRVRDGSPPLLAERLRSGEVPVDERHHVPAPPVQPSAPRPIRSERLALRVRLEAVVLAPDQQPLDPQLPARQQVAVVLANLDIDVEVGDAAVLECQPHRRLRR